MKIRWLPVLLSVIVTSSALFGGWFIYQHYGKEMPLTELALGIEGVEKAESSITKGEVTLKLKLSPEADLKTVYRTIKEKGKKYIGDGRLHLDIESESSPELEQLWQDVLFEVAEAMETKQYSMIPGAIEKLDSQVHGLETDIDMDQENVYVRLNRGDESKFVILPRSPSTMEVFAQP